MEVQTANAAPFTCSPNVYLSQGPNSGQDLYDLTFSGGVTNLGSPIRPTGVTASQGTFNAIGFREADGFIYGLDSDENLIRIESNGQHVSLGVPTGLPLLPNRGNGSNYVAGTVGPDGLYYVLSQTGADVIHVIDVELGEVVANLPRTRTFNGADFVIDAQGHFAYLYNDRGTAGTRRISLTNASGVAQGIVQSFGVPTGESGTYGAAYLDANNRFFISNNSSNNIYEIDLAVDPATGLPSGAPVLVATGSFGVDRNDGAFCPGAEFPVGAPPTNVVVTAFIDVNGNDIQDSTEPLYEGGNAELEAGGVVVSTAAIDTAGRGRLNNLSSGSGRRIRLRRNGRLIAERANITITTGATTDVLIPIDPSGKIYDAATRDLIAGATVTMTNASGTALPAACFSPTSQQGQVTAADGFYRFDIAPGADALCPTAETEYRIEVSATGFDTPPSSAIAPQAGPYNPTGATTNEIVPNTDRPLGGEPTTHYTSFLLGSGDPDVVNNHIALDATVSTPSIGTGNSDSFIAACVPPASIGAASDALSWLDGGLSIYAIGGNTSGLGLVESGFVSVVRQLGGTLTTLDGGDDFTVSGASGPGSASASTVTFDNGSITYSSSYTTTNAAELRTTTADGFISGNSGNGIFIFPEQGGTAGDNYSISIDFTTPVTSFSFDLIDIFDSITAGNPVVRYEVYADGDLFASINGAFLGDDSNSTLDIVDSDGTIRGQILAGQNIEDTIGFVSSKPIGNVSIRHIIESGSILSTARDPHGFDQISYTTSSLCQDYSDAPASFSEVRHVIGDSLQLGATIDADGSSLASADASSDGADDDGITLPALTQSQTATIIAEVSGAGGFLQGWIDFDGSGTFDAGEQIATDLQDDDNDGQISVPVNVPANAITTQTFARFRWSTTSGLDATTAAPDGEVEDYAVTIATSAQFVAQCNAAGAGDPFADEVVRYSPVGLINARRKDPSQILGAPDFTALGQTPEEFVSLGQTGGELVVAFRDNILSNSGDAGPDLSVSEIGDVETFNLFVFPYPETELILQEAGIVAESDGSYLIASNISTASVDIDPIFGNLFSQGRLQFAGVRIVSLETSGDGPDIDALTANFSQSCSEIRNLSDYSDAPIATFGEASHEVVDRSIFLGNLAPDAEPSARQGGNNGINADGDGVEDDGVVAFPVLERGNSAVIPVSVTQSAANEGFLQGWLDYDGDGTFGGFQEQFAINLQSPTAGTSIIDVPIVIPADTTLDQTFIRLRWSTIRDLDDRTSASDGEVEDYAVTVSPVQVALPNTPAAQFCTSPLFTGNPISTAGLNFQVGNGTNQMRTLTADTSGTDVVDALVTGITVTDGNGDEWMGSVGGTAIRMQDREPARDQTEIFAQIALARQVPVRLTAGDFGSSVSALDADGDALIFVASGATGDFEWVIDNLTDGAGSVSSDGRVLVITANRIQENPRNPGHTDFDISTIGALSAIDIYHRTTKSLESVNSAIFDLHTPSCDPDYSDAPLTYGDATHELVPGIMLGNLNDQEAASLAGPNAVLDGADDDGVSLPSALVPGTIATIPVVVFGNGFLQAWFDWNANGVFDSPVEQVAADVQDLNALGTINLQVNVPSDAVVGQTFARFRWSSDFNIGPNGSAPDGEVEDYQVTIGNGGTTLAGRIFIDNGEGGAVAHDGLISGSETGGAFGAITLFDGAGNQIAIGIVNPDGTWNSTLPLGSSGEVQLVTTATPGYRTISEDSSTLSGVVNASENDGSYTFNVVAGESYTEMNIGVIANPRLTQNQIVSVSPGQTIDLTHAYIATTSGTVSFALVDQLANPAGAFTSSLFSDDDCDGIPDQVLTGPIAVSVGQQVCLVVSTQASGGVGPSASYSYGITASTVFTGTVVTQELRNDDAIGAGSHQDLVLRKLVSNLTKASGEGTLNIGYAGDVLRYRIVMSNPSAEVATNVIVYDETPAYTTLVSPVPSPITLANGITCALSVPASNVVGYSGPLQWDCPGSFPPGGEESLTFDVQIEQ